MEETTWQSFLAGIQAVFTWWYTLIPGVVLSLINVVERVRGKELPIPPRWIFRVFVAGLIVAQFIAYTDLRKQIISSKPSFVVSVEQSINRYENDNNVTVSLLAMGLTNRGADSSVTGYKAHFHSASLDSDVSVAHLVGSVVFPIGDNMQVELKEENYIYNRTISTVQRGSSVIGRLPIIIPGNHMDELGNGSAVITVTITDYLGKEYSGTFNPKTNTGHGGLLRGEIPTLIKPPE